MLNLNIKLSAVEKSDISYEDVLFSQLDFQEAYQTFIDYKNVCEIVIKAKSSQENIDFASNLLNISVENIQISVETLKAKLKEAWDRFIALWKKFTGWIKNTILNIKNGIRALVKKYQDKKNEEKKQSTEGIKRVKSDSNLFRVIVPYTERGLRKMSEMLETVAYRNLSDKALQEISSKIDQIEKDSNIHNEYHGGYGDNPNETHYAQDNIHEIDIDFMAPNSTTYIYNWLFQANRLIKVLDELIKHTTPSQENNPKCKWILDQVPKIQNKIQKPLVSIYGKVASLLKSRPVEPKQGHTGSLYVYGHDEKMNKRRYEY